MSRKRSKKLRRDGKNQDGGHSEETEHWSRQEKYDCDIFLESNYRKHLSRHANKYVFLFYRLLFSLSLLVFNERHLNH